MSARSAPRFEPVAAVAQRLAVLTAAGIAPLSAWRHVATEDAPAEARDVVSGLESAHELPERLVEVARTSTANERSAWAALAAIWWVASEAGAALASTLDRSAEVLRALAQTAREVEVALAGPTATSRVVLALPVVGLALGMLLGFDVLGAFLTVPGAICLAAGAILILLGARWNRRLVRAARELDATPGLGFELFAVALSGGASIERARALVNTACAESGLDPPGDAVDAVLEFSRAAGVPVVTLLRAEADERRREFRSAAARRAAELETRLLVPLGLCVLPAFVLLGVAPIGLAIVSSTVVVI